MNWKYVVSGGLLLVLAGLFGAADYVSTSITTDGSFLLASSGQTDNGTYASRVMAADASEITRSMTGDDSLAADISVTSSGPILVSDYASGRGVTALPDTIACVFTKYVLNRDLESELYSMGILSKGRYATSRVAGPGLTGGMDVNGSGMMSFGSHVVGNSTMRSSGFVSGNMTIHDFVKYGGEIMIWEIVSGFLGGATVINGIAAILVYRQYLKLASESMEFAALVVTSIQEQEDGSVTIDPLALAATSMDHISQLSGLLKWVRL